MLHAEQCEDMWTGDWMNAGLASSSSKQRITSRRSLPRKRSTSDRRPHFILFFLNSHAHTCISNCISFLSPLFLFVGATLRLEKAFKEMTGGKVCFVKCFIEANSILLSKIQFLLLLCVEMFDFWKCAFFVKIDVFPWKQSERKISHISLFPLAPYINIWVFSTFIGASKEKLISPIHAGKSFCRDQIVVCFHQHCFPAAPLKHWYNKLHVWLWSNSSRVGRRSKGCAVCVPYFQIICENNKNIIPPPLVPDQAGWLTPLKR